MHDFDPGSAEFHGRAVYRPVWGSRGALTALVETPVDRAAAAPVAAMERFYERMRPEENALLPTGFTLHQTQLLRAAAPADAHVLVVEGDDSAPVVSALVPGRAQMRLFELMFGEQFSLEVLDHAVNERPAPKGARRSPGFRPGGAEPSRERFGGNDTMHHAFAKVRLTLHLRNDQRRYFDGIGMAQDAVREHEATLAELHSSRRSGRDGIGEAWRNAVQLIAPVFRPAWDRGSETLDQARALVLKARAAKGPAMAALPSPEAPAAAEPVLTAA